MDEAVLQAYVLLQAHDGKPAGTVCYRCQKYDYDCAVEDTRLHHEQHVSMTTDPNGGYPFFTVPARLLKEQSNG